MMKEEIRARPEFKALVEKVKALPPKSRVVFVDMLRSTNGVGSMLEVA